jgi:hypothetical protein
MTSAATRGARTGAELCANKRTNSMKKAEPTDCPLEMLIAPRSPHDDAANREPRVSGGGLTDRDEEHGDELRTHCGTARG